MTIGLGLVVFSVNFANLSENIDYQMGEEGSDSYKELTGEKKQPIGRCLEIIKREVDMDSSINVRCQQL